MARDRPVGDGDGDGNGRGDGGGGGGVGGRGGGGSGGGGLAQHSQAVRHALSVREAVARGNYVRFFRLATDAPHMGPHLLRALLSSQRATAMKLILRAYRPEVRGSMLQRLLGFGSREECLRYCTEHGISQGAKNMLRRLDAGEGGDFVVACKEAQTSFTVEQAAGTRLI